MAHHILLYYLYTHFEDAQAIADWQRDLCVELGLKGRIIVAQEGINGTVEGELAATETYVERFLANPLVAATHFKRSVGDGNAFPKLSVKVRSEIVSANLGEDDVDPTQTTGAYVSAEQLHQWLEEGKDVTIVDMRNDYEHEVGHFEGSILPKLENFRDLPSIIPELEPYKTKTVVTVCTGGVRCEKASGYLVKKGFEDVYQLEDGIVTYMEKFPNRHFKGSLYVFDGRIKMGFETDAPTYVMVGRCEFCGTASERYMNCANHHCHRHFIACETCMPEDLSRQCARGCKVNARMGA